MRSRLHADCFYEDTPPDSPPAGPVVLANSRDKAPDISSETSNSSNAGELRLVGRGDAIAPPLPSPTSLQNFRPLLLTDYEDPLLYALSDISLEDMNMSLWVSAFDHRKRSETSLAVFCSLLTERNSAFIFPRPSDKRSSWGIHQAPLSIPSSYILLS